MSLQCCRGLQLRDCRRKVLYCKHSVSCNARSSALCHLPEVHKTRVKPSDTVIRASSLQDMLSLCCLLLGTHITGVYMRAQGHQTGQHSVPSQQPQMALDGHGHHSSDRCGMSAPRTTRCQHLAKALSMLAVWLQIFKLAERAYMPVMPLGYSMRFWMGKMLHVRLSS